jgi:hypothetical protein
MSREPALTPDEWRIVRLWRAGKMVGGKVRGAIDGLWSPEIRHAVAAQCLYGEPFGFTREDAAQVRYFATWASNRELVTDERQDHLHRIADKLAALLPPEAP